jgi:signal peptidase I
MSRTGWIRFGQIVLGLFVMINLLMYASAKWNPDRMPGIGKWRVLSVLTGSMEPTIAAGDMVIVAQYRGEQPLVGEIITFWQDQARSSVITHRVMERLDNGFVLTKGDANQETDGGWTDPERIVGKVVATIPYAARLQNLLRHPAVLVAMIIVLLGSSYRTWRKEAKESVSNPETGKEEVYHEQSV